MNHESVITFNDLYSTGESMGPLPHLYAGFTWSQSAWFLTREQMPSLRAAQPVVLFNTQGNDLFFESNKSFELKSMLLSALWDDTCEVLIEGWAKGAKKYASPVELRRHVSVRPQLAFSSVDRVSLITREATSRSTSLPCSSKEHDPGTRTAAHFSGGLNGRFPQLLEYLLHPYRLVSPEHPHLAFHLLRVHDRDVDRFVHGRVGEDNGVFLYPQELLQG